MTTKNKAQTGKEKQERRYYPAKTKCEAILSVWSERRKPSEVCKELGINWAQLNQWQNQAMAAMMKALEPKRVREAERGPALGPKLERLLEKTTQQAEKFTKLEKRLEKIQNQNTSK